jgi:hypothetical protein
MLETSKSLLDKFIETWCMKMSDSESEGMNKVTCDEDGITQEVI